MILLPSTVISPPAAKVWVVAHFNWLPRNEIRIVDAFDDRPSPAPTQLADRRVVEWSQLATSFDEK